MSITQQYLLDGYRAAQHDERTPPAPGTQDWQVIREVRDYGRFRAVVGERPARGRVRAAVARFIRGSGARTPRPHH
ncbi:hypothetical protein ABZ916_23210 [Streptomyces sp. NPDC046853]|uniref:hypothetical protein n=1 Tax=Streptomyces sp. NPDC046853 TaxID=3154920 RepID=UPI0033DD3480